MGGKLPYLVFDEMPEGQKIDATVAVLGEIPQRQLGTVSGSNDEILVAAGEVVEGRHAKPRLSGC